MVRGSDDPPGKRPSTPLPAPDAATIKVERLDALTGQVERLDAATARVDRLDDTPPPLPPSPLQVSTKDWPRLSLDETPPPRAAGYATAPTRLLSAPPRRRVVILALLTAFVVGLVVGVVIAGHRQTPCRPCTTAKH